MNKKYFPLILLFIAFVLELINIPYVNKTIIFITGLVSSISFSMALYMMSEKRIYGIIWFILAFLICIKVNIIGIITVSLLFLFFRLLPPISRKYILKISLLLCFFICIFFYDIVFLHKTLKCTNMISHILSTGVYGQEANFVKVCPVEDLSSAVAEEPAMEYNKKNFFHGNLSMWNPYQGGGMPFIGIISAGYFNFFDFFLYLLPDKYAWDVYDLFRLLFAGFFMFLYMKELKLSTLSSLAASLSYIFSGPVIIHITDVHMKPSMLFPLLLFVIEKLYQNQNKKNIILTSVVLTFLVFTGFPEHIVLISLIGLAYFIFRSIIDNGKYRLLYTFRNIFLPFIVAICAGFIIIIPFAQFLFLESWSSHNSGTGFASYQLADFFSLFIPFYDGKVSNLYIGIVPFIIAIFAFTCKNGGTVKYFWLFCLVLFCGKLFGFPVFNLIGYIPVINLIYFPANSGQCFALILSVLTGIGLENIYNGKVKPHFIYLSLIFFYVLINIPYFFHMGKFPIWYFKTRCVIIFFALAASLISFKWFKAKPHILALLFFYVISGELFISIPRERLNRLDSFPKVPYVEFLREEQNKSRGRSFGILGSLSPNVATAYEIDDLGFYMPLCVNKVTTFYRECINPKYFVPGFFPAIRFNIDCNNKMLNMLNLKYLILPEAMDLPADNKWQPVYKGEVNIYKNMMALDRVFIVHRFKTFEKDEDNIKFLKENSLLNICSIYKPEKGYIPDIPVNVPEKDSSWVRIIDYKNDEVFMDVSMKSPGILVFNDVYYPGWKVFVNNKEETLYRTNFLFRGVFLKEGHYSVRFVFFPWTYYTGKIISLFIFYILFIFVLKEE